MAELLHRREYYTKASLHQDPLGLCYRITSKWNHFIKTSFRMLQDFKELDEKRYFVTDGELIWRRKQLLETNDHFLG